MISKEDLQHTLAESTSLRDAGRRLGAAHTEIKRAMQLHDIKLPDHFTFGKKYTGSLGSTINNLTVTQVYKKDGRFMCRCDCKCGKKDLEKRLDTVLNGRVPSCGCISRNRPQMIGSNNPSFTGVGELRSCHYLKIKRTAERRGIEFKVTKEYLWGLYLKQDGKCALSGMSIGFGRVYYAHETTASLDRIDSNKVYEEDNLQWVYKDINKLKHDFNEAYFLQLCESITNHQKRKTCQD